MTPAATAVQDGLLLVNKPIGPTSYDMIRRIKRALKPAKIGHCGTLDPIASGLLIILVGKATKRQSSLMGQEKVYRCTMKLGLKTDSGDTTGKTVEEKPVPALSKEIIEQTLTRFEGEQTQIPPMYSALKVQGTPLYKLARKGETVERKPRTIQIREISFLGLTADSIDLRVTCSTGTYVRTLVEDIGAALGSVATMSALVREKIGDFSIADAVSGDDLPAFTREQIFERLKP